jgi:hypothetical protein
MRPKGECECTVAIGDVTYLLLYKGQWGNGLLLLYRRCKSFIIKIIKYNFNRKKEMYRVFSSSGTRFSMMSYTDTLFCSTPFLVRLVIRALPSPSLQSHSFARVLSTLGLIYKQKENGETANGIDALKRHASNDHFSYVYSIQGISAQVAREREQEKYDERRKKKKQRNTYTGNRSTTIISSRAVHTSCSFLEESHHFRVALLFGTVQGRLAKLWVNLNIWKQQAHTHQTHTESLTQNIISR